MSRTLRALLATAPAVTVAWLLWIINTDRVTIIPHHSASGSTRGLDDRAPLSRWAVSTDGDDATIRSARPLPPGGPAANPSPSFEVTTMTLEQARRMFPDTDPRLFQPGPRKAK